MARINLYKINYIPQTDDEKYLRIEYKLCSDLDLPGNWQLYGANVHTWPNGYFSTPVVIEGLIPGACYQVKVTNICGGSVMIKEIHTDTIPTTTTTTSTTTTSTTTTTTQNPLIQVKFWADGLIQTHPEYPSNFFTPNVLKLMRISGTPTLTAISQRVNPGLANPNEIIFQRRNQEQTIAYTTPFPCTGTLTRTGGITLRAGGGSNLGGGHNGYKVRIRVNVDGVTLLDVIREIIGDGGTVDFFLSPAMISTMNELDVHTWCLKPDGTWN